MLQGCCTYVMFLNDFLKASVIELSEFGQIVHISNDIAQYLFQLKEIIVCRRWSGRAKAWPATDRGVIKTRDNIIDLHFTGFDALDDLLAFLLLEKKDLLELGLEQGDEGLLIIFGPFSTSRFGIIGSRLCDKIRLECLLEFVVRDVIRMVLPDHGRSKVFAEPRQTGSARGEQAFLEGNAMQGEHGINGIRTTQQNEHTSLWAEEWSVH